MTTDPHAGQWVTPRGTNREENHVADPELRSAIGSLQVGMGRIEEKVDNLRTDNERADKVHSDHEQRIRRLERWMYTLTALAAAGGSAAGSLLPKVIGS